MSPQTRFIGSPCSVYARPRGDVAPQRYTVCAIKTPRPQLICFVENVNIDNHVETYTREYDFTEDPIVSLEVQEDERRSNKHSQYQLLIMRTTGHIECFSQTLNEELWTTKVGTTRKETSDGELVVRHAAWISSTQVGKLLLKGRQDLMPLVQDLNRSNHPKLPLVLTIGNESGSLFVSLYQLVRRPASPGEPWTKVYATALISSPLPARSANGAVNSEFRVDTARGFVIESSKSGFFVIDLKDFLPSLKHSIPLKNSQSPSFQILSSETVVTIARSSVDLIDLRYHSIIASQDLSLLARPLPEASLDLRGQSKDTPSGMSILCFIRRLRVLVILRGLQIFACNVQDATVTRGNPRKRKRDSGLCGSLLQGICQDLLLSSIISKKPKKLFRSVDKTWEQKKFYLDKTLKSGTLDDFDVAVLRELQDPHVSETLVPDRISSWTVQFRPDHDAKKVDYLMTRVFRIDRVMNASQDSRLGSIALTIRSLPERLHHWLVTHGLFTRDQIQVSLRREGILQGAERLPTDALVKALIQWDPHLKSALSTITGNYGFDIEELVVLLRAYLDSVNARTPNSDTRLITNSVEPMKKCASAQHGDVHTNKLKTSPAVSEARKEVPDDFFNTLLVCLQKQPKGDISKALRNNLSPPHLRTLIDMLRLRLAGGGWLTPYPQMLHLSSTLGGDVASIVTLLDCALNGLGITGWIVGSSASEELIGIAEMIEYMKAEMSAAIEGILDAKRLEDTLGQMLLYEKRVNGTGGNRRKPQRSLQAQEPSLPVGIPKPADLVSSYRVAAGGVLQKRTARDIGRLKSRTVGKYTFERIRV